MIDTEKVIEKILKGDKNTLKNLEYLGCYEDDIQNGF